VCRRTPAHWHALLLVAWGRARASLILILPDLDHPACHRWTMTGSPSHLSTIGWSWSAMCASGPGLPRSRIRRDRAEAPGHIWYRKLGRAVEAAAADNPGVTRRTGQQRSRLGGVRDGSANGSAFCSEVLCPASSRSTLAPFDLRRRTSMQATASGIHSWGSRGRQFHLAVPIR